ncbi:MAG: hypothetical protein R8G66_11430 [Cytophagales bacterium]|nr:hypothetical protein [Cytophagales bacterium]
MKKILMLIFIICIHSGVAQHRVERPLQLQVNLSGLFVDLAANSLADNTVDDLNVNSWYPGLSLGYHFNRYLFVGYSFYAPLDLTLKESWGLTLRALDADIVLEHQTGPIHQIETRFSPFKVGLYASLAYANVGKVDYQMDLDRKGDELLIGNNAYSTDLNISWNSKNVHAMMLGLGYSLVLEKGLSFNLGLSIPLSFPDDENIQLVGTEDILLSDIVLAQRQIREETFYGPVVLQLNIGYNFTRIWE